MAASRRQPAALSRRVASAAVALVSARSCFVAASRVAVLLDCRERQAGEVEVLGATKTYHGAGVRRRRQAEVQARG